MSKVISDIAVILIMWIEKIWYSIKAECNDTWMSRIKTDQNIEQMAPFNLYYTISSWETQLCARQHIIKCTVCSEDSITPDFIEKHLSNHFNGKDRRGIKTLISRKICL